MSLADELLADLEDVGGNDEEIENREESNIAPQPGPSNGEDSDTEMVNGEEDARGGLVLEGKVPRTGYPEYLFDGVVMI
jgi:hypothetical protein